MPERELPANFQTLVTKKDERLCAVKYCRKRRLSDRSLCSKHKMERWRAANPMRAGYSTLGDHARRRRLAFTITFEDYEELCRLTSYLDSKGTERHCLQLDRIDPLRGYEPGNLRVITCAENTSKGNSERWGADYRKELLRRKGYAVVEEEEGLPDEYEWFDTSSLPASTFVPTDDCPF